ncbi:hypothetical protein [Kosakonia cowanii]|uniref:hypothetical protein n=1 Tax=Kosakonia cowanii TaxID=208223 RepID=UPI004064993D
MRDILKKIWFFLKAIGKLLIVTIILILVIILPAILKLEVPITLILGVISLSLTVLAGTDFVKKNTQINFTENGTKYDLWMIVSIAISISGVIAIWIDKNADKLDKIVYFITVGILAIIVACSVYMTCKEKKKAP